MRRRADGIVAAVSHGQHVPTLTAAAALRVMAARPGDLDLLTLKVVSESRVTCDTSVLILVFFLGLSVLDIYARCTRQPDRQTSDNIIA